MANPKNSAARGESAVNWDEKIEYLRGLAQVVKDEKLSELCVEADGVRLHLQSAAPGATMVVAAPHAAPGEVPKADAKAESGAVPIVSPIVGVFYRAPSPNDPPFVEVGDAVQAGQVVGVVEAMLWKSSPKTRNSSKPARRSSW
jgi:acetyl-CoA carboxylase biotin carboxyl carrier protein